MTIYLDVRPTKRRNGQYIGAVAGRDIVSSHQPFLDAARELLGEGIDPGATLVMRWATTGTESLRGLIGVAAKLTVNESCPDGVPRFRSYRSYGLADASHIAPIDGGATSTHTAVTERAEESA